MNISTEQEWDIIGNLRDEFNMISHVGKDPNKFADWCEIKYGYKPFATSKNGGPVITDPEKFFLCILTHGHPNRY